MGTIRSLHGLVITMLQQIVTTPQLDGNIQEDERQFEGSKIRTLVWRGRGSAAFLLNCAIV